MVIGDDDIDFTETIDEDDQQDFIDPSIEENQKQIQQAKDQTVIQRRQRSGEILPFQSWRRQSTFRKQSVSQVMQLSKQQSSQQLLQPITLSSKDKQIQQSQQQQQAKLLQSKQPQSNVDNTINRNNSMIFRKGSVVRRPTLRADSTENAKLCVTNDLEDFIEVSNSILNILLFNLFCLI